MTETEAEDLLKDRINPDGSYLVRNSHEGLFLSLKYFDVHIEKQFKYQHQKIESDGEHFWFDPSSTSDKGLGHSFTQMKTDDLNNLIQACSGNKQNIFATNLTCISLIPNPHSDETFEFHSGHFYLGRVPMKEIKLEEKVGAGQFGDVYSTMA